MRVSTQGVARFRVRLYETVGEACGAPSEARSLNENDGPGGGCIYRSMCLNKNGTAQAMKRRPIYSAKVPGKKASHNRYKEEGLTLSGFRTSKNRLWARFAAPQSEDPHKRIWCAILAVACARVVFLRPLVCSMGGRDSDHTPLRNIPRPK